MDIHRRIQSSAGCWALLCLAYLLLDGAIGMTSAAQISLEIIEARLSSKELVVRYRISNKGKTLAQYISGTAKESWPTMPFLRADYAQKVLHVALTIAECPTDRFIEVPYAYRLDRLEPSATVEKSLSIRRPLLENPPYATTENKSVIDVRDHLKALRLYIGVLLRPDADKAQDVYIGCANSVKSEDYTIITSEKKF